MQKFAHESLFHDLYQIPMEEVLSKKEQLINAITSTEEMIAKHNDKYVPLISFSLDLTSQMICRTCIS